MATEKEVIRIGHKLEKMIAGKTTDHSSALDLLTALQDGSVSLETLKKTRIGMTVNNFRKATNNEEAITLSKQLIKRWKKLLSDSNSRSESKKASKSRKSGRSKDKLDDKIGEPDNAESTDEEPGPREPDPNSTEFIRSKCRELLCNALKSDESGIHSKDPMELAELIEQKSGIHSVQSKDPMELAELIEQNIFSEFKNTESKYKNRVRSRVANLKDTKHPALKENVLRGIIPPETIAKMTAEEMASDSVKELRAKFTKEAINDYQMAKTGGANTDLFKCGRCEKRNCTYNQVQILCSDEPMTTFVLCNECGHRWKFT